MTGDPIDAANACEQRTSASPSAEKVNKMNLSCPAPSTLQSRDVSATLVPGKVLARQHAIIGRATCVVRVELGVEKKTAHSLVFKLSFQPRGRIAEGKRLGETQNYVKTILVHGSIVKHLSRTLDSGHLDGDTTATQSRIVSLFEREMNSTAYGMRNVRILVMAGLVPIKNIKQGDKLLSALVGVVTGYKWLYEKMGVMHRDVNAENMMYRLDGEGNVIGILIDYDHAIQHNKLISTQRTGTRPYMAIDLLKTVEPLVHLCRHDLESIMYSVLDLACYRHASAEVQKASPIHEWFDQQSSESQIANSKSYFLSKYEIPDTTKGMGELVDVVNNLFDMFAGARAHMTLSRCSQLFEGTARKPFDLETMDGTVTLGAFAAIFGI